MESCKVSVKGGFPAPRGILQGKDAKNAKQCENAVSLRLAESSGIAGLLQLAGLLTFVRTTGLIGYDEQMWSVYPVNLRGFVAKTNKSCLFPCVQCVQC